MPRPWWGCGEKRSGEARTGVCRSNPGMLLIEALDQDGLGDGGEVDPRVAEIPLDVAGVAGAPTSSRTTAETETGMYRIESNVTVRQHRFPPNRWLPNDWTALEKLPKLERAGDLLVEREALLELLVGRLVELVGLDRFFERAPVVLAFANDWSNGQATGGNAADAGLRAGDPDLCLTELVDTAPQSADGTGKKNPEPDQETLCGDGFAVNRQRILTIAAT